MNIFPHTHAPLLSPATLLSPRTLLPPDSAGPVDNGEGVCNLWVLKPGCGSRGVGIELHCRLDDIMARAHTGRIVQRCVAAVGACCAWLLYAWLLYAWLLSVAAVRLSCHGPTSPPV